MKNILTFIILAISYGVYAQTYTLTFSNVDVTSQDVYELFLANNDGVVADVSGLDLGAGQSTMFTFSASPTADNPVSFSPYDSGSSGIRTTSDIQFDNTTPPGSYLVKYFDDSGGYGLTLDPVSVPEPSTNQFFFLLTLSGLTMLLLRQRQCQQR